MARSVQFKYGDVMRVVKGARAGGMDLGRVETDPVTGKITIFAAKAAPEPQNALDAWLEKQDAGSPEGA